MRKVSRLRGKFKGYFFLLRLDRLIPAYSLKFLGEIADLSKWISVNKKDTFNDFYCKSFNYDNRIKLFEHIIKEEKLDSGIDYMEFGVSTGGSFRWWIENLKNENNRFYGFDTFSGLPEDWGPFKAGDMSNGNEPPKIDDDRHLFYQGLFQQTLIPFLADYKGQEKQKVIHMDADLYTATLYVLTLITPYLKKGDIILFDEFNVPMHEFKAFTEWSKSFYIDYKVLGGVNNFYQVAIQLK